MGQLNLTHKLIKQHLISGRMSPGEEISIKIDQTLTQDATGTLVMLELEAMNIHKPKTDVSVQYVDHNILETDNKNAEDHIFLLSAAEKFGIWYSRAGNGVSHVLHAHRFALPGNTLLGSDSHTPSCGALGMLAIGTGGVDVALAIGGEPYYVEMPRVCGVELRGKLPAWTSAKDIILEMLRRLDVDGGRDWIFEYFGSGLKQLSVMDRFVIANMGTELGATTSVFPSDEETRRFLRAQERPADWRELLPDKGAKYDKVMTIDLSRIEPLIACPSSPGKVKKVKNVEGLPVSQVVIGSSANPGLRDYYMVSSIVEGRTVPADVSFDVNPSTRQVIENLSSSGALTSLIKAGARFHQTGCLGCIGMGQAPAKGKISLRTMPRNFPGRSGTAEDQVYLCSPETAAASALTGKITDPRSLPELLGILYPQYQHPKKEIINKPLLFAPQKHNRMKQLEKGDNIKALPKLDPLLSDIEVPVILKVGDQVSTDEILSGGSKVLPLRSNIPAISKWCYHQIDKGFYDKALRAREAYGGHLIIAGHNYAQGSSREHAALAPKYLGQRVVIAKSYARIGWQNLINYGILPLVFEDENDYEFVQAGDILSLSDLNFHSLLENKLSVHNHSTTRNINVYHRLSERQTKIVLAGGMVNYFKGTHPAKNQRRKSEAM